MVLLTVYVHPSVCLLSQQVPDPACFLADAGGLLYFGGPMNAVDQLQYNAHRIYGFARLPLITANWEVLGVYNNGHRAGVCGVQRCEGLYQHWQQAAPGGTYTMQPVVVMRNRRNQPCQH